MGSGAGVFVVGSLHLDVIVNAPRMPGRDETLVGHDVSYAFGGKGGNQAIAAARHGASTAMAGRVGDDDFAIRLLAELDRSGVDRSQVRQGGGPSGMSAAIVDGAGDYGAVIVSGANLQIDPAEIDLPADAGVLVLQNEIPQTVNLAVAHKARAMNVPVILNAAPARALDVELLELTDLLIVNAVEAEAMTGHKAETDVAAKAAAATLAASSGSGSAVVTRGSEGLACQVGEDAFTAPAYAVKTLSTHGAGDAFVGALAARRVAGEPITAAIRYAQAAAALHVSSPVAERRRINEAAVRAFLAERP